MGVKKRFVLSDLGGGLNEGVDPTDIEDKEMQSLRNWYPFAKRLIRRNGVARVTGPGSTNRYTEETTGGFAYKTASGTWTLLVGGQTTLGKMSGSSLVSIPGATYTSSLLPWSFAQYKDIVYACRTDAGTLQRTDGDVVGDAGIAKPSTAPSIAQGATGNLPSGDYIGVVTFYNTVTGAESNPSAVSSTLSLAGNKKINWTDIPVSLNGQVDARRLYRTIVDQQGVYYLVDQINDNTTTSYTDNILETSLGVDASFDNGEPPVNIKYIQVWQERAWLTDEKDLFYSELGLPESHGEFSFIQVSPDDGHKIKGILAFGDKLIVGKTNKMFMIAGVDKFELQTLSNAHGCFSHHSMKAAEGLAFWFGGDNFYQSDGNAVKAIGDRKIRDIVDGVSLSAASRVMGAIDSKKSWYMALIPSGGATEPNKVVVYNYRDDTWTTFDYLMANGSVGAPGWMVDFFDTDGATILYSNLQGGDEDSVLQMNVGVDDDGRDITTEAITKSFGYDKEDVVKIMKDIAVQMTIADQDVEVALLLDEGTVSTLGEKNVSLTDGRLWKRVPLANNGDPAVSIALRLQTSGQKALECLGLSFTIIDLERNVPMSDFS